MAGSPADVLVEEPVAVRLGRAGAGGAAGASVVGVDAQPRLHHHRTVVVLVPAGGIWEGDRGQKEQEVKRWRWVQSLQPLVVKEQVCSCSSGEALQFPPPPIVVVREQVAARSHRFH